MSNPAVIMLTDIATKSGGRFKVEDNIGEAIHIHYDNFRIDLTIKEFIDFSKTIEESLINLIDNNNFKKYNFDPNFLMDISYMLKDLESIKMDKIKLSDITVSREGLFGVPRWTKLKYSRVFRAINGESLENNNYVQNNLINQTNQERVNNIRDIIEIKGYPYNNEYLVFFNNQNYIRDGQHRASSLLFTKGDGEIPILRFYFKKDKYNLKKNRWLNAFFPIMKKKAISVAKKIRNKYRSYKGF